MSTSILSSWKAKLVLALFVAMVIYLTIDAFKVGYEEGKRAKAEMERKAAAAENPKVDMP